MTSHHRLRILVTSTLALAVASAWPGSATPAHAEVAAAPRVAIVVQLAVEVEPDVADQLGAALADALAHELRVEALGGADVRRRLPTAGIADDCLATPACVVDIGNRLTASQLLFLVVVRNGDDFQIDTTAVAVASQRRDARPRIVVHGKANALAEFRTAASRMLPDAAPREIAPIATAATAPGSNRHFTRATWISSFIAAPALVTSGALGLTVRSDYNDCQRSACSDSKISSIHDRAIAADVSLLVAMAATASAVWFYVSSSEPPAAAEHVTMLPTRDGAMLAYGGSF